MDDSFPVQHVTLGANGKLPVFKLFENIWDTEKNPINKDLWNKSSSKSNIYDAMEYLKTVSVKSKETDKLFSGSNIDSVNQDDNKKIIKRSKPKLISITDFGPDIKSNFIKYVVSVQPNTSTKSKGPQLPIWFRKRNYFVSLKNDYENESINKRIKLEWSIETEIIYVSPYTFYQSNKSLTIDSKNMVFYLFVQDRWHEIELAMQYIKNVTVFENQPFIKFCVKPSILSDLQHISDDLGSRSSLPIVLQPKRAANLKDILIVFTKEPISTTNLTRLKSILSDEKVIFNSVERESQELLANLFNNAPKIKENLSNFCINWSSLSKGVLSVFPDPPNVSKNALLTSKKSPLTPNKQTSGIVKLVSPTLNQVPNLILHQTSAAVSISNCTKPLVNTVICNPNTNFLGNHILIATSLTPNRIDPYPNLFNRMINDSSSIGPLAVMSCPVPNQSNFAFQLTAQNTNGLQVNNFQNVYQRPQNHAPSIDVHNGTAPVNNNAMERLMPVMTNLVYIPGRNIGNIFESFNYAPSADYNVLIHGSDLTCLNYGQYLNDNIINFYLNYIRYEKCSDEQRRRSHLFNVFFHTKLQGSPASQATDTPDIRHARVAKWTKKVDIFDKDFIVIPINEAQHWFLAIVCFPWMAGMISYDSLFGCLNPQQPSEIPKNQSEFATTMRAERVRKLQVEKKIDPKPCILLFDSLQHQNRLSNVKLIREYLKSEWDAKRKAKDGPLVFDKNTIRGFNPQVPQQTNTIDCGIYVLHYVEMFFQHPLSLYTKEYFQSSLAEWFDKKTVEMKREFIQKLLLKKGEAQQNHSDNNRNQSDNLLSPKIGPDDSGPDIQIL